MVLNIRTNQGILLEEGEYKVWSIEAEEGGGGEWESSNRLGKGLTTRGNKNKNKNISSWHDTVDAREF